MEVDDNDLFRDDVFHVCCTEGGQKRRKQENNSVRGQSKHNRNKWLDTGSAQAALEDLRTAFEKTWEDLLSEVN